MSLSLYHSLTKVARSTDKSVSETRNNGCYLTAYSQIT